MDRCLECPSAQGSLPQGGGSRGLSETRRSRGSPDSPEPSGVPASPPMDLRRLVVWLSAGILSFQGATLILDLINCTVLGWLYLRDNGLARSANGPGRRGQSPPWEALEQPAISDPPGGPSPGSLDPVASADLREVPVTGAASAGQPSPPPALNRDPMEVFCRRPHERIDAGVSQGLSILAGLALGGSVTAGGRGEKP